MAMIPKPQTQTMGEVFESISCRTGNSRGSARGRQSVIKAMTPHNIPNVHSMR